MRSIAAVAHGALDSFSQMGCEVSEPWLERNQANEANRTSSDV
jgi:hypothetical protein